MSQVETNFIQKCLDGAALLDDIDDYVDCWHESEGNPHASLAEFLGFTAEEYKLWAEKPSSLAFIINARRDGAPLAEVREDS